MGMKVAQTPRDIVVTLECVLTPIEMVGGERRALFQWEPRYSGSQNHGIQPPPREVPMHTEQDCHHTTKPFKPWLAACASHTGHELQIPGISLRLNSIPLSLLLDSGNAITLACPSALTRAFPPCGKLAVTCLHGAHERNSHAGGPDQRPRRLVASNGQTNP